MKYLFKHIRIVIWKKKGAVMMKKMIFLLLLCVSLTGCTGNNTNNTKMDYEETKKLTVDILKTDEGKKALHEILSDEKTKQKLVMDQAIVTDTIKKTFESDKANQFWKKSFEDPDFAEKMAKSMKNENSQLLKELMKDPEYQAMMLDVLKDPEYGKEINRVLKSQEFRKHLQDVMMETFENPLFKAKIQQILLKAASEMNQGGGQGQGGGGGEGQDQGQGSEQGQGQEQDQQQGPS